MLIRSYRDLVMADVKITLFSREFGSHDNRAFSNLSRECGNIGHALVAGHVPS